MTVSVPENSHSERVIYVIVISLTIMKKKETFDSTGGSLSRHSVPNKLVLNTLKIFRDVSCKKYALN